MYIKSQTWTATLKNSLGITFFLQVYYFDQDHCLIFLSFLFFFTFSISIAFTSNTSATAATEFFFPFLVFSLVFQHTAKSLAWQRQVILEIANIFWKLKTEVSFFSINNILRQTSWYHCFLIYNFSHFFQ